MPIPKHLGFHSDGIPAKFSRFATSSPQSYGTSREFIDRPICDTKSEIYDIIFCAQQGIREIEIKIDNIPRIIVYQIQQGKDESNQTVMSDIVVFGEKYINGDYQDYQIDSDIKTVEILSDEIMICDGDTLHMQICKELDLCSVNTGILFKTQGGGSYRYDTMIIDGNTIDDTTDGTTDDSVFVDSDIIIPDEKLSFTSSSQNNIWFDEFHQEQGVKTMMIGKSEYVYVVDNNKLKIYGTVLSRSSDKTMQARHLSFEFIENKGEDLAETILHHEGVDFADMTVLYRRAKDHKFYPLETFSIIL